MEQNSSPVQPTRHRLGSRAMLILLSIAAASPLVHAADDAGVAEEESAAEEPAKPPVAALFEAREELQQFILATGEIDTEGFLAAQADETERLRQQLADLSRMVDSDRLEEQSFEALLDLQTDVRGEIRDLEALSDRLAARATERDDQLDRLAGQRDRWTAAVRAARARDAPPAVMELVAATDPALDDVERSLTVDRDAMLSRLSDIATLKLHAAEFQSELQARRQTLELAAQTAADAPLWTKQIWSQPLGGAEGRGELRRQWRVLRAYAAEHGVGALGWLTAVFLVAFVLLRGAGGRVTDYLRDDATSMKAGAIFRRPFSAALLAALLSVYFLAPPGPVALSHLIGALLPIPAATLAVTVFARPIRLSVYTLALVLFLLQLQFLTEHMPAVGRSLVVVQGLLLIVAFLTDLRRGNWARAFPGISPTRLGLLVRLSCLAFLLIMILDTTGFVGVADTLKNLTFGGLGLGMIFLVASYVLTGFVLALLWVRPLSGADIVQRERWIIAVTLRRVIRLLAVAGWLAATLSISGLMSTILDALRGLLATELSIGAVALSVSALIYGVVILVATLLVSRLVRFFLESGVGAGAPPGATFAISKLVRYVIAVVGFLFAIVVMGFDLTSVTVLAGAVGVGLGFGLQNIFNNFFSGLILLVEQPIRVGDIAKVGDLIGTVREVGIRATMVETFDGAEVVVPNADFISKTVLNWTRSNRRRRAEIDVGVAYGTDPQKVIDILESVAAECEDVSDDPRAMTVFTGFGDSSLNFRLYAWLKDLSNILMVPSRMRQDILRKLGEAGIEVPFPQRDIRVVMHDDRGPEAAYSEV